MPLIFRSAARFCSQYQLAILFALIAAVNYSDRAATATVLAALRNDMRLSDAALGSLGGVFLWSYALLSPLAGVFADRSNRRLLIIASLIAWSLVTVLMGLSSGLAMLLVLQCSLGLCESFYLPSANGLLADSHSTATRGAAMSILATGLNCGVILGGACAGYLAEHFGWRSAFRVFGLVGLLLAPLAALIIGGNRDSGTGTAPAETRRSARELRRIFSRIPFLILLVQALFGGAGTWILLSWLPLYLRDQFGMSLALAGLLGTLLLQAPTSLGWLSGGWISDRMAGRNLKNRMLCQATMYLAAAPLLLFFLRRPDPVVAGGAVVLFSYLRAVGQANENPAISELAPEHLRSTALGLLNASNSAAGGIGVLLVGLIKAHVGLEGAFSCIPLLFVAAGGLLLWGYSTYKLPKPTGRPASG